MNATENTPYSSMEIQLKYVLREIFTLMLIVKKLEISKNLTWEGNILTE